MTTQDILDIHRFSVNANEATFKSIFGDELGEHLWDKFVHEYKRNFLLFFNGGLDADNKDKIADQI